MLDESKKCSVGATLNALRTRRKLTLRELGSRVHLSATFLSRVERGDVQLSLESLSRLARFFECPIGFFFAEDSPPAQYSITRNGNRNVVSRRNRSVTVECLTDALYGNPRMELSILTIKPKAAAFGSPHMHPGEEVMYVMKGKAGVQLGEREVVLKTGETVTFDPRLKHNVRNAGEGEAKVLVAITPPNLRLP